MRTVLGCLGLAAMLGACSTAAPPPLAGKDVACLHHQVYDLGLTFDHGLQTCDAARPDLTGSGGLQQMALAAKVPFTIRPIADARIKQASEEAMTGTLIPGPASASGVFTEPNGGPADVGLGSSAR